MPLRIRWGSKEYLGIALMLLGGCGGIQLLFIAIAQYILSIGNLFVLIMIPTVVTTVLFYGSIIIFEAFAQVERERKLRGQYRKKKIKSKVILKIIEFPISRPVVIILIFFSISFIITYFICITFLDNIFSFIFAENVSAIVCLLIANLLEKNYAKIKRF